MPMRFSTEAANADVMGDDAPTDSATEGMPPAAGADRAPRARSNPAAGRKAKKGGDTSDNNARPGSDINAAGLVKDKDKDSNKP